MPLTFTNDCRILPFAAHKAPPAVMFWLGALLLWASSGAEVPEFTVDPLPCLANQFGARAQDLSANARVAVGFEYDSILANEQNALLWRAGWPVDITPYSLGCVGAWAAAVSSSGEAIVGTGFTSASANGWAILWTGSTPQPISLQPPGAAFVSSQAFCVSADGLKQGGLGITPAGDAHPLLWTGSASSFIDLLPAGYSQGNIIALDFDGSVQVGYVYNSDVAVHAMMWRGASSYVDLTPALCSFAVVTDISTDSTVQVGYGERASDSLPVALLWRSSRISARFLNPPGMRAGCNAVSDDGLVAVGYADSGSSPRAALWRISNESYSAGSYSDLARFLPANMQVSSAEGADSFGNIVGWAKTSASAPSQPVIWRRNWLSVQPDYLKLLLDKRNWKPFVKGFESYKWPAPFPGAEPAPDWGAFGDLTRVGDGQCVAFVRSLTGALPALTWSPAAPLCSEGKIRTDLGVGDVIATFNANGEYKGHTAIILRRVSDSQVEVADQNYATGPDHAMVVAKHRQIRIGNGADGFARADRYSVVARR